MPNFKDITIPSREKNAAWFYRLVAADSMNDFWNSKYFPKSRKITTRWQIWRVNLCFYQLFPKMRFFVQNRSKFSNPEVQIVFEKKYFCVLKQYCFNRNYKNTFFIVIFWYESKRVLIFSKILKIFFKAISLEHTFYFFTFHHVFLVWE